MDGAIRGSKATAARGAFVLAACAFACALALAGVACPAQAFAGQRAYCYLEPIEGADPDEYGSKTLVLSDYEREESTGYIDLGSFDIDETEEGDLLPWEKTDVRTDIGAVRVDGVLYPTSVAGWFNGLLFAKDFDLRGLDFSQVSNCHGLFGYCPSLYSLDLSAAAIPEAVAIEDEEGRRGVFSVCPLNTVTIGPDMKSLAFLEDLFGAREVINAEELIAGNNDCFETFFVPYWVPQGDPSHQCASPVELLAYVADQGKPVTFTAEVESLPMGRIVGRAFAKGRTLVLSATRTEPNSGERALGAISVSPDAGPFAFMSDLPWSGHEDEFTEVVFEDRIAPASMEGWFSYFTELTTVTNLQNVDLSDTSDLSELFMGCTSLTDLDLRQLDTSGVSNMSGMLYGCESLRNLSLGGSFTTAQATDLSRLFAGCSSLESIDWTQLDTGSAYLLFDMCSGCQSLKSLQGFSLNTSKATMVNDMFAGCTSLEEIEFPAFDLGKAWNLSGMFRDCTNLRKVVYGAHEWATEASLAHIFKNCPNLNTVEVRAGSAFPAGMVPEGMWLADGQSQEIRFDKVPSGVEARYTRTSDEPYLFAVYAHGMLTIGTDAPADPSAFESGAAQLYKLRDVSYGYSSPSFVPWHNKRSFIYNVDVQDVASIHDLSYWFTDCTNLEYADLSGLNPDEPYIMTDLFRGCTNLRSVDASTPSATSYGLDGGFMWYARLDGMFDGCTSLTDVKLPAELLVDDVSRMFRGCTALQQVDVSGLDLYYDADLSEMFRGCTALQQLDLSAWNTRTASSMRRMLHGCRSLERIRFGSEFTFRAATVGRLPGSELPTGVWQPVDDNGVNHTGKAYTADSVPNFTDATYVRLPDDEVANTDLTIVSALKRQGDEPLVTVSSQVVGDEEELSYEISDAYPAGEPIVVGDSPRASAAVSGSVNWFTVIKAIECSRTKSVLCVQPSVTRLAERCFAGIDLSRVTIRSAHLTTRDRVRGCFIGSNVKKVNVNISSKKRAIVKNMLRSYSGRKAIN